MKIQFDLNALDFKGRGRMIVALLAGVVFIALKAAFPTLPITEDQSLMVIGLIGAYVLGEGISGKSTENDIITILKSQKFQGLMVGIIATLVKTAFPTINISETTMFAFVGVIMSFIIGAGAQTSKETPLPVVETRAVETPTKDEPVKENKVG
jgi:xanthosine utilization system XapX-like protein